MHNGGGSAGKARKRPAMQDLLLYVTKGLSSVTTRLREEGEKIEEKVNHLVTANLFATITNVNFDNKAIAERIRKTLAVKENLLGQLENKSGLPDAALWNGTENEYAAKAASRQVGVMATEDEDIRSLRELITYGLKGLGRLHEACQRPAEGQRRDQRFSSESAGKNPG